jgi:hypothetical protein
MTHFTHFLKCSCLLSIFAISILACRKTDTADEIDEPPELTDSVEANLISDRLMFNAFKKTPGAIPSAQSGTNSSLKISIKDTLYLMKDLVLPIEFLHHSPERNVAGAYVQVHASFVGGTASYYYDVSELESTSESDTVSTILIGIDVKDLEFPLSFSLKIAPYDPVGEVIDETIEVVTIEDSHDASDNTGECSFILPTEDFWNWKFSMILGEYFVNESGIGGWPIDFDSSPRIVHGAGGQFVNGCCYDGVSGCGPGDTVNARLLFPSFYKIESETFRFSDNGTFIRTTYESSANPDPAASDFCGGGRGVVDLSISQVVYGGNWTLDAASQHLRLQGTSSSVRGGGFGNPGGVISYNCHYLIMKQPNLEGVGKPLEKTYARVSTDEFFENFHSMD